MTYITSLELWKSLGKDSYTKVRSESVGTGDGSTSTWSLDQQNLISGSATVYTDSSAVSTLNYSLDLDDGNLTLTASSGSAITIDYDYSDVPDSHVQEILNRADEYLTNSTGRIYTTASTTEYISVEDGTKDEYFLSNYPVTTISSMAVNVNSSDADTPDWESRGQGLGSDFIANSEDLKIGRFRWIDNFPTIGKDRIKVIYTYGYTSTPYMVKELATLLAQKQLVQSAIYQTIFKGRDDSSPVRIDEVDKRIEELIRKLKKIDIERP